MRILFEPRASALRLIFGQRLGEKGASCGACLGDGCLSVWPGVG